MEANFIIAGMKRDPKNGFNSFVKHGMIFLRKDQAEDIIAGNYHPYLQKQKFERKIQPGPLFHIFR